MEKVKRGKNRSLPSAYSSKERIMEVCFFWFIHPTMELRYWWKHGTNIGTNVRNDNKLNGKRLLTRGVRVTRVLDSHGFPSCDDVGKGSRLS